MTERRPEMPSAFEMRREFGRYFLLTRDTEGRDWRYMLTHRQASHLLDSAARALGCDVYDPADDADSELT